MQSSNDVAILLCLFLSFLSLFFTNPWKEKESVAMIFFSPSCVYLLLQEDISQSLLCKEGLTLAIGVRWGQVGVRSDEKKADVAMGRRMWGGGGGVGNEEKRHRGKKRRVRAHTQKNTVASFERGKKNSTCYKCDYGLKERYFVTATAH